MLCNGLTFGSNQTIIFIKFMSTRGIEVSGAQRERKRGKASRAEAFPALKTLFVPF